MSSSAKHKWTFRARFRRYAFGWRSQPAIKRVKEAVSEIKKAARRDSVLGAQGAVLFLEKVSPAIQNVDGSSGAIGRAVNHAIDTLVPIIAKAPAEEKRRDKWMERLWQAVKDDKISYLEALTDYWGTLCVTPERASYWADKFIDTVRMALSPAEESKGYFQGTTACLSALYKAGRNKELMDLLELVPYKFWPYRKWGVKALRAMGKEEEALRFAEESRGLNQPDMEIGQACEEILLASGMSEEAYKRYAIEANLKTTYLATFRAILKKYSYKKPADVLKDLMEYTPSQEGKWFAAAKWAGLYDKAVEVANRTPCDPRTLTRAARDMAGTQPKFAVESGLAALRWLAEGFGYEITGADVMDAYQYTIEAAEKAGCKLETFKRIRDIVSREKGEDRFVTRVLEHKLGLE